VEPTRRKVADVPLKIGKHTKEKVRLGAAILACTQGEFVERAVAEYLERHAEDLGRRVDRARDALFGGDEAVVAYLLELDPDEVKRLTS
jgi:hypothetical protein